MNSHRMASHHRTSLFVPTYIFIFIVIFFDGEFTKIFIRTSVRLLCAQKSKELQIILKQLKNKKTRRRWVRKWISRRDMLGASERLLKEFSTEDVDSYRNHLRLSKDQFEVLLYQISTKIQRQDTVMRAALPARTKLEITLRYLATGDCFSSLAALYRIPKNSISVFLPEICASICESLSEYIKVPNTEDDWKKIQNEFYTRWNFPNCVGAVDGKHILIRCPKNTGSEYFNYKHSFSVILLAVVDANYCFSYIDIGTNGRVNDARVFSKSSFYEALENKTLKIPSNGVFVADDAFPLRNDMLKPYSRIKRLTTTQKIFNYRLSRARRIVENAFGILTSRFRILEKPIPLSVKNVPIIIKTICTLHNWLRKTTEEYFQTANPDSGDFEGTLAHLTNYSSNHYSTSAGILRDTYAEKFMTTEAVPWQWNMI